MSTAFDFLLEKMDHPATVQFGVRIIADVLHSIQSTCPKMVVDLCGKCINIFTDLKEETERKFDAQLRECRATGICESHRNALDVPSALSNIIKDMMGIVIGKDGVVDRDSLPSRMPENIKDTLCRDVGRIPKVVEQLRKAKSNEERRDIIELFRDSALAPMDEPPN